MNILIADDDASIRNMFKIYFGKLNQRTDTAPDGMSAFKKILKNDYDVIIADMDMPILNGKQLYRVMKEYTPHLISRMVFATGRAFDTQYEEFFKAIPCPVLEKPFSLDALEEIIQDIHCSNVSRITSQTHSFIASIA